MMTNLVFEALDRARPKRLLDTVTAIVMLLVLILLVSVGSIFSGMMFEIAESQSEKRVIQAAKHVALMPELQMFIENDAQLNTSTSLSKFIRNATETKFVIVTDAQGDILAHPDAAKVGNKIDDNLAVRALEYGRAYSRRSMEEKAGYILGSAPIINETYDIIGMVTVGFPVEDLQQVTKQYLEKTIFFIFVFLTLGLIAAILIARGVKKAIFGLEPSEIAYLFNERSALIESIHEGVIAADVVGQITLANEAALKTLNVDDKEDLKGMPLSNYFPFLETKQLLESSNRIHDKECVVNGVAVIVNAEPVEDSRGLVVSFRERREIDLIARELSQVQTYSDMLRSQTHEYSNSLHTIVGMIQIGAYDDVLSYIAEETQAHRDLVRFLTENVPDRTLSSLIIGKFMYAHEQKVEFNIDSESRMIDIPDTLDRHKLVTILGNLLQNAIDATLQTDKPHAVILSMSDFGNDLIFEIEDSGPGIGPEMAERIFEKGVSTKKGSKRGYGLYLAKKSVDTLGGEIYFDQADLGGARFEFIIPKNG